MPNIASAKKRVRVTKTKTLRNKMIKSNIKTVMKAAFQSIEKNGEDKIQTVRFACKKLDQACSKGIFHRNKVAHAKSRLQCALNGALNGN